MGGDIGKEWFEAMASCEEEARAMVNVYEFNKAESESRVR